MDKITLNLDSQKFLKIVNERIEKLLGNKELSSLPIDTARNIFLQILKPAKTLDPIEMNVKETSFSYDTTTIPLRIYNSAQKEQPQPVLIFFHGGGFVLGDLDMIDYACRLLTKATQCIVIAVEYRKAPEYKFPTAHEDCYQAIKHIQKNAKQFGGNGCIIVAGESAGGNLAASVCHIAKQRKDVEISAQILYYPWVSLYSRLPSTEKFASGYLLEKPALEWMRHQFLSNDTERNNAVANPLLQKDFTHLPPALILAAECDPLHDETKSYFDKLIDAKIATEYVEFAGALHGFFATPWFSEAGYLSYPIVGEFLKRHKIL